MPCDTKIITSDFGYRDLLGNNNFHNGLDFGASMGSNVYAISSGTVVHAGFLNGYGISIIILHANGYRSLYGHLDEKQVVSLGDHVMQGDTIAFVGPKYLSNGKLNGFTTGPHLHLTIFDSHFHAINPRELNFMDIVLI
ncbi:MAG: M23 family metallopeptidase [Clostridia bacterium]|nr:M23 family metallopeptidase [Clostridia bacterium]